MPTLEKYFGYLVESFLFFSVYRFSWKVREQVRSNRKIYCYDNGYYEAKAFRFSPDWGRLYENTVAVELKRRTLNGDQQMFYWMNVEGEEVDFVIQEGLVIQDLIQVCYQPDASATKSREVRALLKASTDLKCKKLTVVTGDYEATESFTWFGFTGDINFVPLWRWLVAVR